VNLLSLAKYREAGPLESTPNQQAKEVMFSSSKIRVAAMPRQATPRRSTTPISFSYGTRRSRTYSSALTGGGVAGSIRALPGIQSVFLSGVNRFAIPL
jgi:hypothetical protein